MASLQRHSTHTLVQPRHWRKAWAALRRLVADPERTDEVFEILDALAGGSYEKHFQLFRKSPDGARLLRERPQLLPALADRAKLRALPQGSFGRCYADFMDGANLTAEGLIEAEQEALARINEQKNYGEDRNYFNGRLRDMHDLWHVLTGYGRDEAGEAANLAFTLGQIPDLGVALIVLAAGILGPKDITMKWPRYLLRAWQRGRRTSMLSSVPYEELLKLPIEEVRNQLRVVPAEEAHPSGIIVANSLDRARPQVA